MHLYAKRQVLNSAPAQVPRFDFRRLSLVVSCPAITITRKLLEETVRRDIDLGIFLIALSQSLTASMSGKAMKHLYATDILVTFSGFGGKIVDRWLSLLLSEHRLEQKTREGLMVVVRW